MKINFDEFFSQAMPLSTIPASFSEPQQPQIIKQQQMASQEQRYFKPNKRQVKQDEKPKQNKLQSSQRIIQKLSQMTQHIEQQKLMSRKQPKVNIQQITNKLYQPTPTNKKNCTKNVNYQPPQQPQQTSRENTKRTYCPKSGNEDQFPRYVRLYNLNKINSIRSLYRAESHEAQYDRLNSKKVLKTKASQSYLQNYVPFYDRLENEVNRSAEKIKFYQNNPQYSCGQQKQLFKPTTIDDKIKRRVESRYNKQKIETCRQTKAAKQLQNILNSSINTSYSLDKSVQIINRVEEHFFDKMKVIFLNQQYDYIVVTEHLIEMLSDVQFKILQNFIMEVEEYNIPNHQFQPRIRQYYYNLQPHQKLELRSHQAKKKNKLRQNKEVKPQANKKVQRQKRKINKKVTLYHKKVENFI